MNPSSIYQVNPGHQFTFKLPRVSAVTQLIHAHQINVPPYASLRLQAQVYPSTIPRRIFLHPQVDTNIQVTEPCSLNAPLRSERHQSFGLLLGVFTNYSTLAIVHLSQRLSYLFSVFCLPMQGKRYTTRLLVS